MNFKVGFATDVGRKRQQNQDNAGSFPEMGLFLVADGMGGHRGGETASAIAVESVPKVIGKGLEKRSHEPKQLLTEAIRTANQDIYKKASKEAQLQGMGTTTTSLLFLEKVMIIGHVGDSRCYYLRPNAIWQVTRDHSLVQEKLRAGLITREQLKTDRMKNVITRSVGFESDVNVEIYEMPVQSGDVFLICSDGLSGMLDDPEILKIVQKDFFDGDDIQKTANDLIAAANENGGEDNVTVLVIQVH